jgi:hypothetical protein
MARAVLSARRLELLLLSLLLPACGPGAGGGAASCPATLGASDAGLQATYAQFRQTLEQGPVAAALGPVVSCAARAENGALRLEYRFAESARLEAQRDPAIELTEQRLTGARLSREAALALLRRMELQAFGQAGCEIAWSEPPAQEAPAAGDSGALVYRGAVCNCQARLELSAGVVSGLLFRSAC